MPEMPGVPQGPPPGPPDEGGGEMSLEGMDTSQLLMLSGNALALASQKVVDEFAGQGDAAARLQQLVEEAVGGVAQALQEIQKLGAGAPGAPGGAPAAPAPPEAPAGA